MNIVTSVGYGDMYGTNDTERIVTCIIIMVGDALFAVAFGMMATLAASNKSEIAQYLNEITSAEDFLSEFKIPDTIMSRVEQYYAYRWAMKQVTGALDLAELYAFMP
jgi:hypothetical protein